MLSKKYEKREKFLSTFVSSIFKITDVSFKFVFYLDASMDAVLQISGSEQERVPPRGSEIASPPIRIPFRGTRKGGAPHTTTPLQYPVTGKVGPESGYDILEGSAGISGLNLERGIRTSLKVFDFKATLYPKPYTYTEIFENPIILQDEICIGGIFLKLN